MTDDAALTARLDAAARIAAEAGATALSYFRDRGRLTIERKSGAQDLVSEADRTVETQIRDAVRALFPDDGLIGEEHAPEPGRSGFSWVIDPIDGTSPFLNGLPTWCVSVAVAVGERPMIGVIDAPALGERYVACRGRGGTLNGERLALDPTAGITAANIGVGSPYAPAAYAGRHGRFIAGLMAEGGVYYRNGSGAVMLAYVSAGRLAGCYDPTMNAWDCFAGMVLIEEAGGLAVFEGASDPARRGTIRAGSPAVVEALGRIALAAADG